MNDYPQLQDMDYFNIPLPINIEKIETYVEVFDFGVPLTVGPDKIPLDKWIEENLNTTVSRLQKAFSNRRNGIKEHFDEDLFSVE